MSDKQYTITADWMGDNDEPVTVAQAQSIIESFNMHPDWRFIVEDYGDELRIYAYRNEGESTLTGDWTIVTRDYGYQIIGELSHIEEQQTPDAPEDTSAIEYAHKEESSHIDLITSDGGFVSLEVNDELLHVVKLCINGDDSFNHRIGNLVVAVRTIGGTFLHIMSEDGSTYTVKRTKAEWIALKDEIQSKLS